VNISSATKRAMEDDYGIEDFPGGLFVSDVPEGSKAYGKYTYIIEPKQTPPMLDWGKFVIPNGEPVNAKLLSVNEALATTGNKIHKLITGQNLTLKGKKYPKIEFEVLGTDNGNKLVKLRILSPKQLFGQEMNVPFRTIKRGPFLKTDTDNVFEMAKSDLKNIEKYADSKLSPEDIEFTKHFFDRVNDSRNRKEITNAELIGFFKRLSKYKKKWVEFLKQYDQIVVKDKRTDINIPFVKQANQVIAKTIMRKPDFKTSNPIFTFESVKEPKGDSISELVTDIDKMLDSMETKVISEGGAYGHMNHPFDTEINLTFGQLKDIVSKALNGDLELTREKTDGQALAVSWKNGKLIAARNKGHLKNKGENALDIKAVADKFKGRGELEKAYNFAMSDLSKAIKSLSEKQREVIFQNGGSFMNLEVIYPTSVNVIPYGQSLLIFHGTMQYNDDGIAIGENQGAAKLLANMIKQVNQHVQDAYSIQGPPVLELPKSQNLSSKQSKYNSQITKLQKEFGLKDSDGVANYHQAWWENWITKNSPTKLDKSTLQGLTKRWAFFNKSFRLDNKNIKDEKTLEWAKTHEKDNHKKISKDNLMKFENIFLGLGAEVLQFTASVITVNPDKAIRDMKKRLDQTIKDVKSKGDAKQIAKLKLELERLNSIGGPSKIVPNEGIVFVYGTGKNKQTFKLTGSFAALNQILGIFY
jgi:hypothetical protein